MINPWRIYVDWCGRHKVVCVVLVLAGVSIIVAGDLYYRHLTGHHILNVKF